MGWKHRKICRRCQVGQLPVWWVVPGQHPKKSRNISRCVRTNSSQEESKKKKDHISLIPGKNETKSKDSGCSFLVSFLLLLPPRDDGKGGFKQETIKLSDLGLAVKLGKRGHVKGDSSA